MDGSTVVERFAQIDPASFETEVNDLWASAERIKDTVIEEVREHELRPLTGLAIVSCITGQMFGYGLFHGQPAPADLVSQLDPARLTRR